MRMSILAIYCHIVILGSLFCCVLHPLADQQLCVRIFRWRVLTVIVGKFPLYVRRTLVVDSRNAWRKRVEETCGGNASSNIGAFLTSTNFYHTTRPTDFCYASTTPPFRTAIATNRFVNIRRSFGGFWPAISHSLIVFNQATNIVGLLSYAG